MITTAAERYHGQQQCFAVNNNDRVQKKIVENVYWEPFRYDKSAESYDMYVKVYPKKGSLNRKQFPHGPDCNK